MGSLSIIYDIVIENFFFLIYVIVVICKKNKKMNSNGSLYRGYVSWNNAWTKPSCLRLTASELKLFSLFLGPKTMTKAMSDLRVHVCGELNI